MILLLLEDEGHMHLIAFHVWM